MYLFIFLFFISLLLSYTFALHSYKLQVLCINNSKVYIFFSFLILLFFIGSRYDIGRDFQSYYYDYYLFASSDYGFGTRFNFEYMNYIILYICHYLKLGPISYFYLSSCLMLFLFYKIFKNRVFLLPQAIIIFLLCGCYTFIINGIRQGLAILFVIYALTPSKGKTKPKLLHYILCMGGAFICHNSSILFLPIYLLYNKKILSFFNSTILIIIVLIGYISSYIGILQYIPLASLIGFDNIYSRQAMNTIINTEANPLSVAIIINLCTYIFLLSFTNKVEKIYPESKIYFILFAFGIALNSFFGPNILLKRLSFYLFFFNILSFPYLYSYFKQDKKLYLLPHCLNLWFIIYFIGKMPEFWALQVWENPSIYGINL